MLGWVAGGFGSVALWQASQGLLNHGEVSPVKAGEARRVGCNMICFGRQGIVGCCMAM